MVVGLWSFVLNYWLSTETRLKDRLKMNQKPDQPSANLNLAPIDRFNDLLTVAESKREKEIKISIQSARNLSYAINQLLTRAVEAMQDRSTLKNEVKDLQNPTIEVDGGQF